MFVMWHSHSFVGRFSFHLMRFQKMQVSLGEKRAHKGLAPTPCGLQQQTLVVEVLHFRVLVLKLGKLF